MLCNIFICIFCYAYFRKLRLFSQIMNELIRLINILQINEQDVDLHVYFYVDVEMVKLAQAKDIVLVENRIAEMYKPFGISPLYLFINGNNQAEIASNIKSN